MAKIMTSINDSIKGFIEKQHLFFVGTAAKDGRVNISPKGMDTLRVVDKNRVVWMNLTGSGNETAAHLLDTNRMTLMFCSFAEMPLILRLYGSVKTLHKRDDEWAELSSMFPLHNGARQIFDLHVETVQTSCGYAVPFYDFKAPRNRLAEWADKKGEEGILDYWEEKNTTSIDGFETGIFKNKN
ncbi:MAG: pyridoxamine 5'-phosphate oxidase family protein [Bacteroidota bacterium]